MLNIKTIRNQFAKNKENAFCFISSCSQNLSTEELISEMKGYNSSFTEADVSGMLSVLKTVVVKHLSKGYKVELPFGTLRANVNGTCRSLQDGFVSGTNNNKISFIFNPKQEILKTVSENLEYRQLSPESVIDAKIYRVTAVLDDTSESDELALSCGKILRFHGKNLSFDLKDEKQGVFLETENGTVRLLSYTRRGTNVIDAVITDIVEEGFYNVYVTTKPGSDYSTAFCKSEITVE